MDLCLPEGYLRKKNVLGFSAGSLPFVYLGVLIFKRKPRAVHLQHIADKIKVKLSTWKGLLLSIMRRVQLVKSVIYGSLLYSFQVSAWPISLLKKIDAWIRNFIWSGDVSIRKLVIVSRDKVCSPFDEGGFDIRPIRAINEASTLKLY